MNKPLLLIILDGFGIAEEYGNAIKAANKPNLDRIFNRNPITQIQASSMSVGLPEGQMATLKWAIPILVPDVLYTKSLPELQNPFKMVIFSKILLWYKL